ncbi:hypothetical protein [Paeniglutamicibacter kerguelensis]|uniref:DUF4383 domain-containing protein n=1 Tax=Paeniglutamicibacter kerguelensis TaxID=254788 RepID=A0ABS4XBN7_9MICC|nr:hypothetical protein [Paeniglutamicibacter kerguelensis]MBP2385788.1 hypothetical protein [Paeniglutamicibacter kerguelensis]
MKKLSAVLPARSRTHTVALGVGAATWLAGFVSVYLVAPVGTGLNVWQSYAAFQAGSNAGNALALAIYAVWGAGVLFVVRGSRLSAVTSVLGAHGLIGIGVFYPAAVMGFGIAHVVGYEDDVPSHGGMAMGLVVSGGIALVLLFGMLAGRRAANLMERAGISGPMNIP